MPADILTTDTLFPELNGGESTDQKFEMVTDYLWLLREQLTYALTNLGIANFNQTQLGKLSGIIAEPLQVVLAEQETQFTAFGVELGLISGRITKVEKTVGDDKSGLVQKMAQFELKADGFTQSFTAIGKVLNGEDGKSGLVKDVAEAKEVAGTVAGNYISKSAVTQTAKGFELAVTTAKRNTYGDIVYDKDGAEVEVSAITFNADGMTIKDSMDNKKFEFKTKEGSLWIQGTIEGSRIFGSEIVSCSKDNIDNIPNAEPYLVLAENELIAMGGNGLRRGVSLGYNGDSLGYGLTSYFGTEECGHLLMNPSSISLETGYAGRYIDGMTRNYSTISLVAKGYIESSNNGAIVSTAPAQLTLQADAINKSSLALLSADTITLQSSNITITPTFTQIDATSELLLRLNPGTSYAAGLRLAGTAVEVYAQGGFWVNSTRIA